MLVFHLSREVDGLWRPQSDFIADLSPVLPASYLAHEVDGPWRPQGDRIAGLLTAPYLAHEVDGPWRPRGDRIVATRFLAETILN